MLRSQTYMVYKNNADHHGPRVEITYPGNGLYRLQFWNMGGSNDITDVTYVNTFRQAVRKAKKIIKERDRFLAIARKQQEEKSAKS